MDGGYSICLNKWALDKDIKNELGLLLIISSLCAEKGFCFASNTYLAKLFDVTEISISTKLGKLKKKNYIEIEYEKRGCEVISRKIRLKNILTDDLKKFKPTIKENFKDNNISINNISINNKKEKIKKEKKIYFENEEVNNIFIEFLEQRKKMKVVNSERAIKLLINKLNKHDDDIKIQMLEEAILKSWKSVYEIKKEKESFAEIVDNW